MKQIYVKHNKYSGTWIVDSITEEGDYICVRNSDAYSQHIFKPHSCTRISESRYESGYVPAPDYRYDY